ncbi:MAG: DUF6531 domain-containing protein [Anaerolineae bacterium]
MSRFKVAWDTNGNLARTSYFYWSSPVWEDIKASLLGNVNDSAINWFSSYITSGYESGGLGAWVVTTSGTTLRVYYSSDIRAASVTWTLQATFTMSDSSVVSSARIATSKTQSGFAIVAWKDRTGTLISRTTDGSTWSTAVQVGSSITDLAANDNAPIGLAVDGVKQLVTAPDGAGAYFVYLATTTSATFTKITGTGSASSARPFPVLAVDPSGNAYARTLPVNSDWLVTFDSGEYSNYSVIPAGGVGNWGNPGNGARWQYPGDPTNGTVKVCVYLGAPYTASAGAATLSFNWKASWTWNGTPDSGPLVRVAYQFRDAQSPNCDLGDMVPSEPFDFRPVDREDLNGVWQTATYNNFALFNMEKCSVFLTFFLTSKIATASLIIDNIHLNISSTLYRISNYDSNPTWTNITPSGNYEPSTPYALVVDPANSSRIAMLAGSGASQKLFTSSNQGSAWVDKGTATYRGLQCYKNELCLFGNNISLSRDLGDSFENKNGNWSSVFGGMGTVLGIIDPAIELISDPSSNGLAICPANYVALGTPVSLVGRPVSLQTAEKYEEVTDLTVQTPAGPLAFTRSYRQAKLADVNFQFMGLGWKHNHLITLTEDLGVTPNTIWISFTNGGETLFLKKSTNYYEADRGSVSFIDVDPASDYDPVTETSRYKLTTSDKSLFLFDANKKLRRRRWPNGEYWEDTYSGNKLSEVVDDAYVLDGSNLKRKLIFTYYPTSDQQLYRVTDHLGRYIEFTYVPEKNNGTLVSGGKSLLATVRDVRGQVWTYDAYGQNGGEADSNLLNYLTKHLSPPVDTTGDGTTDGTIKIKDVTYTFANGRITDITEQLGIQGASSPLMQVALAFKPNQQNVTTETVAGKTITHHFSGGIYNGAELPGNNGKYGLQDVNDFFRPSIQKDANGNTSKLDWSGRGKSLTKVTDPLNNETNFDYNTNDTLNFSVDSEGRKTQYDYTDSNPNNSRLPTRIKVFDKAPNQTTVLRWQEFTYDSKGRVLTEKVIDPANGTTILQQTTREYYTTGDGNGLLKKVTQSDIGGSNNTTTEYTYDTAGRVTQVKQTTTFGDCCGTITQYDAAGNVTQTTNIRDWTALSDAIKNPVTTYAYDEMGRRTKTTTNVGTSFAQTSLTFYDSLDRVVRTIGNYTNQSGGSAESPGSWVWSSTNNRWEKAIGNTTAISHGTDNNQNIISDTQYNARGMVRFQQDTLGNVTLYGYDDAGRLIKTVQSASVPGYNNDYINTNPDPTLGSYTPGGAQDKDIISTQSYDAAGNLVKTVSPLGNLVANPTTTDQIGYVTFTAYDALNRPVKVIRNASQPAYNLTTDPGLVSYTPSTDPDKDMIETTEYDAMGRVIRTQRLMENRVTTMWDTTLYGYDPLGRQVKVVRSASQPTYNITADPPLAAYTPGTNPDQDIITKTAYDTNGRVLTTEDVMGAITRMVYDGLGRQMRTVANFKVQGTSDPKNWVYESGVWKQSAGGTAIQHGAKDDENIITSTTYDANGRVLSSQDVLGRVNRNVYDVLGRIKYTIANYVQQGTSQPEAWVWSIGNSRWENGAGVAISFGTDNDQNVISETVYDNQGRVSQTNDKRHNASLSVYDAVGRRVKSITNYVQQGTSDPANWVWDTGAWRQVAGGTAIDFGTDKDQNRISTTTYDRAGRVTATRDAAGLDTRFFYDALGRRIKSVTNYVVQGASLPENWLWSTTNNRWENGAGVAIDHNGVNYKSDQNLISTSDYNRAGQVTASRDARGTQTTFTYDKSGRRLTVMQAAGTWLATSSYTCYDKAGRVLRSITTYVPLFDASNQALLPDTKTVSGWAFIPPDHGSDNDANLITEFTYDLASRRISVTNPAGDVVQTSYYRDGQVEGMQENGVAVLGVTSSVLSKYRYDGLRRRFRVVQGYVAQGTSDPQNWVGKPKLETGGGRHSHCSRYEQRPEHHRRCDL